MNEMLKQQTALTLPLAMHALQSALDNALTAQIKVSIAIVDPAGHLVHMAHMDGAPLQSRDIALNKARTAVGFGVSTNTWQARLENCSQAVRQGLPLQANLALFGGGEPLRFANQVIGAIGVSGASEAADHACAEAAVARVTALLADT